MKIKLILLLLLAVVSFPGGAQQFSEKISRELGFEKPGSHTVMIFNIKGRITVTGTTGDKVIVEVEKVIHAKTDRRLELGKTQITLGVMDRADSLLLYVEGGCGNFGKNKGHRNHSDNRKSNSWGYIQEEWNNHNDCRDEFDYEMNFTLKVPAGVNLYASTINNGDVKVENIAGTVYTSNINGSISLKNISGATDASTINGSVDLEYLKNPPQECRYYSLNGDINAFFRKGLTANLTFESFNGELYTNLEQLESIPSVVEKIPAEHGIKYKLLGNRFKVGKGGVLLDFETFNGDVYVKEMSN